MGAARLLPAGQIFRIAVLLHHRKLGVGAELLGLAVEKASHQRFARVYLIAQTHARGFYERAGFVAEGEEFRGAGITHYRMTLLLNPAEDSST